MSVLCNPPAPGDPSYELFAKERADEFASLQRRAALVSDAFNSLPNMSVVPTQAAMYAFPEVRICVRSGWWAGLQGVGRWVGGLGERCELIWGMAGCINHRLNSTVCLLCRAAVLCCAPTPCRCTCLLLPLLLLRLPARSLMCSTASGGLCVWRGGVMW